MNWRWLADSGGWLPTDPGVWSGGGESGGWLGLDPYQLLAGLVFGTIGLGAFTYGRKLDLWQPRAIGLGLMVYPYLVSNTWLLWGIGAGLLVLLWFYHHE